MDVLNAEWRVGSHYGIHYYAKNPYGDDIPLGTALNDFVADAIVREHNHRLNESKAIRNGD
jgi:hypothetical protein